MAKSNKRVSQTAWLTAYTRSFYDIPYAREIFQEFDKLGQYSRTSRDLRTPNLTPLPEARHKLLNKLLAESGLTQILEVASGMSPRGLSMTENKAIEYVEMDLPGIIAQKTEIVSRIKKAQLPNLHLESGNALNPKDLERASRYFNPKKPVAVLNEGLIRYFNSDEKAVYAKNVHSILKRFGGSWITSDIPTVQQLKMEDSIFGGLNNKINKITNTDQSKNSFESMAKGRTFFKRLGFSVQVHSVLEVKDQLYLPEKLGLSDKAVEEMLGPWAVFVMAPA